MNISSISNITNSFPKAKNTNNQKQNVSFGATAADPPTAINVQNANVVVSRIA